MLLELSKIFAKKVKVVVHSGKFHADDVSAVAILSLYLNKPLKIFRSRDPKVWAQADYVFDVGGEYKPEENKFDHHQGDFKLQRENGIGYSSAGLAWKHFGKKIAGSDEVWKKIDEKIIQYIDADDIGLELYSNNFDGIFPYAFGDYIDSFNPTSLETNVNLLKSFEKAVEVTKAMFQREIKKYNDKIITSKPVQEIYKNTEDKRLIILDGLYSWSEVLMNYPEPLFVVYPRLDTGTWAVQAVGVKGSQFKNRQDLPETWAGKRDKELIDITRVEDAIFCHKGRFIAVAQSKDGAIALAKLALNQNKN